MSEPQGFRPKPVLTIHEAAVVLGVSGSRVRGLIGEGLLPEHGRLRTGGAETILLRREEVERLARDGWPGRRAKSVPKPGV